jgi:hypothetical protein
MSKKRKKKLNGFQMKQKKRHLELIGEFLEKEPLPFDQLTNPIINKTYSHTELKNQQKENFNQYKESQLNNTEYKPTEPNGNSFSDDLGVLLKKNNKTTHTIRFTNVSSMTILGGNPNISYFPKPIFMKDPNGLMNDRNLPEFICEIDVYGNIGMNWNTKVPHENLTERLMGTFILSNPTIRNEFYDHLESNEPFYVDIKLGNKLEQSSITFETWYDLLIERVYTKTTEQEYIDDLYNSGKIDLNKYNEIKEDQFNKGVRI